jgi:hypothetical protein
MAVIGAAISSVYGGALVLLRSPDLAPVMQRLASRFRRR